MRPGRWPQIVTRPGQELMLNEQLRASGMGEEALVVTAAHRTGRHADSHQHRNCCRAGAGRETFRAGCGVLSLRDVLRHD